jgi:hypothetical protein
VNGRFRADLLGAVAAMAWMAPASHLPLEVLITTAGDPIAASAGARRHRRRMHDRRWDRSAAEPRTGRERGAGLIADAQ